MKSRRKRGRFGTLLFALPIILFVLVIAYQLISETYFNTGTLIVEAKSSGRYYPAVSLNASVSVGTRGGTTPATLSLTQGTYTVVFTTVQWYTTPQSRTINVVAGKTSYALGVYDPIVKGVSIEGNQFNATTISAKHGVTPIVLINRMSGYAVIQGAPDGTIIIQSAQNYTHVFQNAGTYTLTLFDTSAPGLTVSVA
jgi:hypothetical protein